ncbi:MAG: PAS domain S-box protein, partial [Sulfuriferula sp.]
MIKVNITDHLYLAQILENSPDGIFTIDSELHVRYVNSAFCRMLNYTEEELIGSPITDHLGDINILATCMASVDATGKCNDQETIFKRRDGTVVHISKNVQAINDST